MKTKTYTILVNGVSEVWEVTNDYMMKLKVDNLSNKKKSVVKVYNENNELIYTSIPSK